MTTTSCTCHNGTVPATGNGLDGYEPCPDCAPDPEACDDEWMHANFMEAVWGRRPEASGSGDSA